MPKCEFVYQELEEIYPNDRAKTLQINNVKDNHKEEIYYIRCFREIEKWIKKIEKNEPVYILESKVKGKYDLEGIIRENHTYFNSKNLGEVLVVKVEWKEKIRVLEIKDSERKTISLVLGSITAKINGTDTIIKLAPIVKNGKSYLPVRVLAQLLGENISYIKEGNNHIYKINSANMLE